MAQLMLFRVTFRMVKAAAALGQGKSGSAYTNVRDPRTVIVAAASGHPKDILAVLTSNITPPGGESFEILSVANQEAIGTEGNVIYS